MASFVYAPISADIFHLAELSYIPLMNKTLLLLIGIAAGFAAGFFTKQALIQEPHVAPKAHETVHTSPPAATARLHPGAFSMSLSVKDLQKSKSFYETLGFTAFGGSSAQHYLIMKNGNALIGLFQGMFEGNMLTFNPGWDENAHNTDPFDDIRTIQRALVKGGITIDLPVDEKTKGPGSLIVKDPDGNTILLDQHR